MDGHHPLQLWEGEKTSLYHIFAFEIWEFQVMSRGLTSIKCECWLWFGNTRMGFGVCSLGVWVSWWWAELDTEKPNTDSHLCSCSRIIQGYCRGKFCHCDPVWKELSHTAWLWGCLPFTGSHLKVQSWMLIGKDLDASKRKVLLLCSVGFHSALTSCLVNLIFCFL